MSKRASRIVLLCEDQAHAQLVRAFLRHLNVSDRVIVPLIASELGKKHGGNIGWVIAAFPEQLEATLARTARSLLIVVADADDLSTADRRRDFPHPAGEAVALLIPKRHIETWLRVLGGVSVTELDDCKAGGGIDRSQYRAAAEQILQCIRGQLPASEHWVPSLVESLPEWQKLAGAV